MFLNKINFKIETKLNEFNCITTQTLFRYNVTFVLKN